MVSITRLYLMMVLVALPALSTNTIADTDFSVSSTSTENSSTANVSFVKQWTLSASNTRNDNDDDDDSDDSDSSDDSDDGDDKIDSIKLQLPGRVFVSYTSSMPSGVLGYVNVSGDSQAVVETVKVNSNDDDEELEVKYDSSSQPSGYLLTEIFLATRNIVTDVEIESTAEVVIEDGVLVRSNTDKELQIKASDSSVVYVESSAMTLQDLKLELSDRATLQLTTDSITIREDGQFQAHDKSSIAVITSSLSVDDLDLDAESSGTICISATDIVASNYDDDDDDASKISLPNASTKYTATGSLSCDAVSTPSRAPGCVSRSACSTSTTSASKTTAASSATSTSTTTRAPSSTSTPSSSGVTSNEQTSSAFTSFSLRSLVAAALAASVLLAGM